MKRALLIHEGTLIDPSQKIHGEADVLIVDGKVEAIGKNLPTPEGCEKLNASGLMISPGWIDLHTHLREPGGVHKETIKTGTQSAAAGGFTTIACMANTQPVNDNPFITQYIQQKIRDEACIQVHIVGAITKGLLGEELAEIGSMVEAGIKAISDDGKTVMNSYVMRKALDYSKRFGLPVISHAEDSNLKGKGVMNEGFHSTRFGLRGIPRASEEIIVARDILLADLTKSKIHIAHVSTRGSVELVRAAKKQGVQVTAEVTPHHLTLTDEAVGAYDTNTKVAPPLREPSDIEALQEALADGTLDILASDHAPHAREEKEVEFDLAEFGMVGLETAFPLYYKQVLDKKISLDRLIEAMSTKPAQVFGLPQGTLKKGADADLTIFDPKAEYTIDATRFFSKSKNTPFHGWKVRGKVCYTLVKGKTVYSMGKMGEK